MSALSNATADWQALDTSFYRQIHIYDLAWPLQSLREYFVSVLPFGGPIALLRNPAYPIPFSSTTAQTLLNQKRISVFTPSAEPFHPQQPTLAYQPTPTPNPPICLSYIPGTPGDLLVVFEDGSYRVHFQNSASYSTFQIGLTSIEDGVVSCRVYTNGFVVLLGSSGGLVDVSLVGVTGSSKNGLGGGRTTPVVKKLASVPGLGIGISINGWSVMNPEQTNSRQVTCLLSVGETVMMLDEEECIDQRINRGPFTHLLPSPSGRFLALLAPHPKPSLWVLTSDFAQSMSTIQLLPPDGEENAGWERVGVEWVGEDAVGLAWWNEGRSEGRVTVCGPGKDNLEFIYDSYPHIAPEADGLRVYTTRECDFIQRVPQQLLTLLLPGSSHPSTTLLDAHTAYLSSSPLSHPLLKTLSPSHLSEGINALLHCASEFWEPEYQKICMSAAVFGRGFLEVQEFLKLEEIGKGLRVCNELRRWEVGVPVSYQQYLQTPASTIISLLLSRSLHLLSLRLSSHLSLSQDPVLLHWACSKISCAPPGKADDEICKEIVVKLDGQVGGGGRFAEVASMAWTVGRRPLATMLLDHESRAANQVPLLLNMHEDRLALDKALDSGDTDLIYYVLLHLKSHLAQGDFFRIIDDRPKASSLLEIWGKECDREMLKDFYYQDDRRLENGLLMIEDALLTNDINIRLGSLKGASKFFSEDKDRVFESKAMDEYHRLTTAQESVETEVDHKVSLVGLSISDSIRACLIAGLSKKADKFRADFKVPDKRFWYIKMKALVELKEWDNLEVFARSRKSPIGYEPWVNHLVSEGYSKQAVTFVPRCDSKNRVDLYVKCGDFVAAAQECKEKNDKARLEQLKRQAPTTLVATQVEAVLSSMNRQK